MHNTKLVTENIIFKFMYLTGFLGGNEFEPHINQDPIQTWQMAYFHNLELGGLEVW